MRTTVTLDADTEQLIRARMRRESVSFKQALNDAIRAGMAGTAEDGPEREVGTTTFAMGVPTLDLTKALRLAGDLEDDALVGRLGRGG